MTHEQSPSYPTPQRTKRSSEGVNPQQAPAATLYMPGEDWLCPSLLWITARLLRFPGRASCTAQTYLQHYFKHKDLLPAPNQPSQQVTSSAEVMRLWRRLVRTEPNSCWPRVRPPCVRRAAADSRFLSPPAFC